MPSINIDSLTIHYEDRGQRTGESAPLVLLHSFPHDRRIWQRQLEALSADRRVIIPDLPGFGLSKTGRLFSIADHAELVHEMLTKLSAAPCVLGGISMGGYIALALSKSCPTDLAGLILVDTRAEADTPEGRANRDKVIETVRARGAKPVVETMVEKQVSPTTLKQKPEVVEHLRSMMEACPAETIVNASIAMRDREDYGEHLPSIAVPTLILVGEDDALTPPAMAETLHRSIPRSKLVTIAAAGHLPPLEQPDEVTRHIQQFIDRL